jgi:hypothetical protein
MKIIFFFLNLLKNVCNLYEVLKLGFIRKKSLSHKGTEIGGSRLVSKPEDRLQNATGA